MNDNDFLKPGDTIRSNKQLVESPEVEKLAEKVMEDNDIDIGPAEVGYILVYPHITKKRAAKLIKCNRELRHYAGNHYIIEVSGEAWDMLDPKTRQMVLLHELLCIHPVYKAKSQEWVMKKRKPDFADFYEINDRHGNDWYKTVQATVSSLYDMSPQQERDVKL